jgi:hypothetical protein
MLRWRRSPPSAVADSTMTAGSSRTAPALSLSSSTVPFGETGMSSNASSSALTDFGKRASDMGRDWLSWTGLYAVRTTALIANCVSAFIFSFNLS